MTFASEGPELRMCSLVKCLPSMPKVLCSIASSTKKDNGELARQIKALFNTLNF